MPLVAAVLSCLLWIGLWFGHGRFWQKGPILTPRKPPRAPDVAIVVPARDEAESIAEALRSLLDQDYDGRLRVILVDDQSSDGTAAIARGVADPHKRLTVIDGLARPEGWSGKLWAVHQGTQAARADLGPDGFLLLTDADILHAPTHVATLVAKALEDGLDLVSEMVALNCESAAERALVPAFVFFFAMLYPFAKVADPSSRVAGAAGGTILLQAGALDRIGGIAALRGALIDDCTLAAHVKRSGGKLYLGHSTLAWSVRPYPGIADIWRMIARTAYVQLRHSPLLMLGTVLGMTLIWIAPVFLALFGRGTTRRFATGAWMMSMMSYVPTLRRFELGFWRVLPLPLVAAFYLAATIGSAVDHYRGRGVRWKNRAYQETGS
jgi:hopene-associated glycosyltransferase HpnB